MEDIKGIKFNIFHRQTTREGDPCDIKALGEIDLSAIDPSRKDAAPLIQTFDCGHRIAKGNIDGYSSWNLTTFTDLDWKKYKQNGETTTMRSLFARIFFLLLQFFYCACDHLFELVG